MHSTLHLLPLPCCGHQDFISISKHYHNTMPSPPHPCSNMVATREEYAGLPPKKRPARPAVSKGAAGSEGGKPAAAAPAAKEAKGVGKDAAAAKDGGKGKAEAPAAAGAAAEGEKRAGGGAKDEGRRTTDSSKGPSLPPGLGGTARGRREEPARPERERREERRRDERGAAPAAHDGPPPGVMLCSS